MGKRLAAAAAAARPGKEARYWAYSSASMGWFDFCKILVSFQAATSALRCLSLMQFTTPVRLL